jgi:hypothetical protein
MVANYIFIVQKEHRQKYNLDSMLNLIMPNCKIVEVDGIPKVLLVPHFSRKNISITIILCSLQTLTSMLSGTHQTSCIE